MLNNTGASFGPSPPGDGTAATLPGLNANMLTPSPAKEDYHELLDISGLQMVDGKCTIVHRGPCTCAWHGAFARPWLDAETHLRHMCAPVAKQGTLSSQRKPPQSFRSKCATRAP